MIRKFKSKEQLLKEGWNAFNNSLGVYKDMGYNIPEFFLGTQFDVSILKRDIGAAVYYDAGIRFPEDALEPVCDMKVTSGYKALAAQLTRLEEAMFANLADFGEPRFNLPEPPLTKRKCSCDIYLLMRSGCECGGI